MRQIRLSNQKSTLIDEGDPARERIVKNGQEIADLKAATQAEKKKGVKKKNSGGDDGGHDNEQQNSSLSAMNVE